MGFLGGYKLVSFRDIPLETNSDPVEIKHLYNRCKSLFCKRFVAIDLNIDGADYSETDMALHLDDDNNFVAEVATYIIIITPDDEVTVYAHGGAVDSVNGKTGVVVLDADDIDCDNSQSVQDNLERIDEEVEGIIDDLDGKLDATKQAVSEVGGLVVPTVAPDEVVLVGVDTGRSQVQVEIGSGLILTGTTSPYTLEATGGGGAEYIGDNPINIWTDGSGDKHIQWVAQQGYNMYFDRSGGADLRIDSRPTNVFNISVSGSTVTLLNSKTVEDIAEAFSHYGVIELRKTDGLYIEKCYHLDRFAPQGKVVFSTITEDTANTTLLEVITFNTGATPMEDLTTGTIKTKTISF